VVHGDTGLAGRWVTAARLGDPLGVLASVGQFDPPENAAWLLVAGDHSALPAIGAILESLHPSTRTPVLVEPGRLTRTQRPSGTEGLTPPADQSCTSTTLTTSPPCCASIALLIWSNGYLVIILSNGKRPSRCSWTSRGMNSSGTESPSMIP